MLTSGKVVVVIIRALHGFLDRLQKSCINLVTFDLLFFTNFRHKEMKQYVCNDDGTFFIC